MKKWWRISRLFVFLGLLLAPMLFCGCGETGEEEELSNSEEKLLEVVPIGTKRVIISVKEIQFEPTDKNSPAPPPVTFDPAKKVDLLTFHFLQQCLGQAYIPAGSFKVKLVLKANEPGNSATYLEDDDPITSPVEFTVPSDQLGITEGIKVQNGIIEAIRVEIKAKNAANVTGNDTIHLKPTAINIVSMDEVLPTYGTLSGTISPSAATLYFTPRGAGLPIAAGRASKNGDFTAKLPTGKYRIKAVAGGFAPYSSAIFYNVSTGQTTPADKITLQ